jgi:hypothetical protein
MAFEGPSAKVAHCATTCGTSRCSGAVLWDFPVTARLQPTLAVGLKCGEPARKWQLLPRQRVCEFRYRCIYVRFERHEAGFRQQDVVRGGERAKIQGRELGEPGKGASTTKSPV